MSLNPWTFSKAEQELIAEAGAKEEIENYSVLFQVSRDELVEESRFMFGLPLLIRLQTASQIPASSLACCDLLLKNSWLPQENKANEEQSRVAGIQIV